MVAFSGMAMTTDLKSGDTRGLCSFQVSMGFYFLFAAQKDSYMLSVFYLRSWNTEKEAR